MTKWIVSALTLLPAAAFAQDYGGPDYEEYGLFSLNNTDFVVGLGFVIFVGFLIYMGVPKLLTDQLDKRAKGIEADLAEARGLREEAQTLLASYERKQKEVEGQAERIVAQAREEARAQADRSRVEMERTLDRRLQSAREQIDSAEEKAVREVRNRAVQIAIAASREVLQKQMDGARADRLIDESIKTVDAKLH